MRIQQDPHFSFVSRFPRIDYLKVTKILANQRAEFDSASMIGRGQFKGELL